MNIKFPDLTGTARVCRGSMRRRRRHCGRTRREWSTTSPAALSAWCVHSNQDFRPPTQFLSEFRHGSCSCVCFCRHRMWQPNPEDQIFSVAHPWLVSGSVLQCVLQCVRQRRHGAADEAYVVGQTGQPPVACGAQKEFMRIRQE